LIGEALALGRHFTRPPVEQLGYDGRPEQPIGQFLGDAAGK
jgi:hypothetical protein